MNAQERNENEGRGARHGSSYTPRLHWKPAPDWVWLAFFASVAAVGWQFWTRDYNHLDLPSSLLHAGMALPVLAAFAARASDAIGSWRALHMYALAAPLANVIRIGYDLGIDPTRHNLLPFELVISSLTGYCFVAIGVLAGNLVLRLRRRGRQDDDGPAGGKPRQSSPAGKSHGEEGG